MDDRPGAESAPILRGSPLGRALDGYSVPPLSAGFAARVLAAAEARPAALPDLRRSPSRWRGWRSGRRLAIGLACCGALAGTAAATGLLQRLDLPVPSAGVVWASITGSAPPAAAAPPDNDQGAGVPDASATSGPVEIVGPIDTPEELGEAFRRIDSLRTSRREERRAGIDQRIEEEIARRAAAGLPVPTPEEQARIRERIEAAQARRQQAIDARIDERRAQLQRKVEAGEALTGDDIAGPVRQDAQRWQRIERLRQLPPEERRALIDEFRAGRAERLATPDPVPEEPAEPATQATPDS